MKTINIKKINEAEFEYMNMASGAGRGQNECRKCEIPSEV